MHISVSVCRGLLSKIKEEGLVSLPEEPELAQETEAATRR